MSRFYPNAYVKKVHAIDFRELKNNHIKGILFDVDNTLINLKEEITIETVNWMKQAKEKGFKICILSNSRNTKKIERLAKKLNIPYVYKAHKPRKVGFLKALDKMKLEASQVALVGDQILTDVWGANRIGSYSILVDPISKQENYIIRLKRIIERPILNKYFKSLEDNNV